MRHRFLHALVTVAVIMGGTPADAVDRVALFTEWGSDTNAPPGRAHGYVDPILFAARGGLYALLDVGTFARGLEAGGTWRDRRGASYTGFLRRRQGGAVDDTAVELATAQPRGRLVGTAAVRLQWPDHPEGANLLLIPSVGAEVYTSDFSFAACRAILDPRPAGGVAFMISNRMATRDAFFEFVLVPRTDGVLNWNVRGRWRWFHAGYTRDRDFDFSRIDRSVWTFGLQFDLQHADPDS